MLTASEKKQLRVLAEKLTTRYQIGKNEISNSLICMLDKALIAKELIKIDVQKGASSSVMALALDLSTQLKADIVQVVGGVIVLFRRNKEKPIIKFTK
ncbi:MAG: ribosome assembly RNA-binding protein YhbY [Erysipelotrichaceae bacterium]|jgi:RNA-binding protein|nr:YhbY family RNA-binding protein [Bacilli bacterium]NLV28755.1 ribosome assembly RNA-binding protein YhbY [Erysipelotrichaceae bacterium]HPY79456.1 YhbY family RNA-binding protein [Bacilli bacterium]HQA55524.1 YhbY family RNA-binding protein [Bacilli bacterium]